MINTQWADKISNHAQIGGIESSVLDNGAGRGSRVAWFNTGTGLRFKVVIDRGLDIADAFYNQYSLAWLSYGGITYPQPFSNQGIDWLKTFGGGLLTTCGLTHVGGPETDQYGNRGLHDEISNIPAEIESIIQPDPVRGKLDMSITGTMKQTKALGPSLELKRTISARIGSPFITISDRVVNLGNQPAPHMLLYHFNFGCPLVDEGVSILWKGKWQPRHPSTPALIFREGNDFRICPPVMDAHSGTGEEVAIIDVEKGVDDWCTCGIHNPVLKFAVSLKFKKSQLPWLANWQHWGRNEYVTGLEPATHPPFGQAEARKSNVLIMLEPGEVRNYDLQLEVLHDEAAIQLLRKLTSDS